MKEYRCNKCHKLLLKYNELPVIIDMQSISLAYDQDKSIFEIKCQKCGYINSVSRNKMIAKLFGLFKDKI